MSKKIIFAVPRYASFLIPVSQALKDFGFNVVHFDYQAPNINVKILNLLSNISKIKHQHIIQQSIHNQLIKQIRTINPDYLLVIKGETLTSETIDVVNKMGVSTINWFPDNIGLWNLLKGSANQYQYYFSVCTILTEKLNQTGRKTHYLPVAGSADIKIENYPKQYDLVFAGHKTQKRIKYLNALRDLNFTLFGYPHWRDSNLSEFYKGYLKNQDMLDVFRRSKIIVNVSTGEEGVPINIVNLKNFEATGVGAFVLSEYSPALAELFKEDQEIVFFRTPAEMKEKALYYLKHEDKRNKIALNGWKRTKNEHTYKNRLNRMFNIIRKYSN